LRYLFALKAWHLFHNKLFPQDALPRILILLRSSEWVDASRPLKQQKGTIKLPHLLALVDKLAKGTKRDWVLSDMAIIAFWGLARLAELTYYTKSGPVDPLKSLLALDVAYATLTSGWRQAWLRLRYAKTGKLGVAQWIQLTEIGRIICPFAAVCRRHASAPKPTNLLFGFDAGGQRRHITKNKAVRRFQMAFSPAGFLGLS
jgi:hypothetical protein